MSTWHIKISLKFAAIFPPITYTDGLAGTKYNCRDQNLYSDNPDNKIYIEISIFGRKCHASILISIGLKSHSLLLQSLLA